MFNGMDALIFAPVDFATATSDQSAVRISGLRDGLGVLAVAETVEAGPGTALITFAAGDGGPVYQCSVQPVLFDEGRHTTAQLQSGDCDITLVAGLPELRPGHAQVWETPRPLSEAEIGPLSVADMSTLSDRRLQVLGKTPGMTVLTWISEAADMGPSIKLCPITVADPSDEGMTLDEADLCKDEVGTPMRLSVGQVARMVFLDEDSASTKFGEASVADPSIVDFQFEMGARAGTVTGFRTGSTSLTLLALHAETARNCEIVVE